MLSVAASVSEEGTQLPGRYYPTPPHPTPPHPTPPHPPASEDDAMLSVAASVRGRNIGNAAARTQDVIIPPPPPPPPPTRHLETMLC